jgi:hypothetical protein
LQTGASTNHSTFCVGKNKNRAEVLSSAAQFQSKQRELALTSLKARIRFVDDVNTAFATDQLVVAVAFHQRFQ